VIVDNASVSVGAVDSVSVSVGHLGGRKGRWVLGAAGGSWSCGAVGKFL
jgi:hypothetical protein